MIYFTQDLMDNADAVLGGIHASEHIRLPTMHMRLCSAFATALMDLTLDEINALLGKEEDEYVVIVDCEGDKKVVLMHTTAEGTKVAGRELPSFQEQWDAFCAYLATPPQPEPLPEQPQQEAP